MSRSGESVDRMVHLDTTVKPKGSRCEASQLMAGTEPEET